MSAAALIGSNCVPTVRSLSYRRANNPTDRSARATTITPFERETASMDVGELLPDVSLFDHEGVPWRFSEHRGRTLLLVLHRHLA